MSLPSVSHVANRLQSVFSGKEESENRTLQLGYVSENDGEIEIGLFGAEDSSDERN